MVGNLIWVLLEIYCSLQQWKNFANRSRIDKVIAMVRVAPFFDSRCIIMLSWLRTVCVLLLADIFTQTFSKRLKVSYTRSVKYTIGTSLADSITTLHGSNPSESSLDLLRHVYSIQTLKNLINIIKKLIYAHYIAQYKRCRRNYSLTDVVNELYRPINMKNCSLYTILLATDKKPQKSLKKTILTAIASSECQCYCGWYYLLWFLRFLIRHR